MNGNGEGGLVLGIELSQREGGVAVVGPGGRVHARSVSGGRRDRDELLPAIEDALSEAGGSTRDLKLVVVDIGPGGFTGLRISIATGQAIAEAMGVSVMGIPGADVAVATSVDHRRLEDPSAEVAVVSAVRDGSGWETRFAWNDALHRWHATRAPGLREAPPEGVEVVVADEHLPAEWREMLRAHGVEVVDPRFDAAILTGLGSGALEDGIEGRIGWVLSEDPAKLVPIYPRVPEAVRLWQQRNAR